MQMLKLMALAAMQFPDYTPLVRLLTDAQLMLCINKGCSFIKNRL